MVNLISKNGYGPIGIELGSHAVRLMQFTSDRQRLIDAVHWDLPRTAAEVSSENRVHTLVEAIQQARQGRKFRGRDVVACLSSRELFVQNIRVAKGPNSELDRLVQQEAVSRLPFPAAEADVRYLCAGEVRQGDQVRREVILLASRHSVIDQLLSIIDAVGLRAIAVDVEPSALLRAYTRQFRRDDDRHQRVMFVRPGAFNTTVVIAQGNDVFFVKYVDVGGDQLDDAVANHLNISTEEAATLRRNNGDRRAAGQDPEIAGTINEATRGVIERLVSELAMCVRYHSVTFRGQPINRVVLGGSEATDDLLDVLSQRLDLKCELGDPLRSFESTMTGRRSQWDVTAGLALKQGSR